jgi:copper(I)-binding protein
MTTAKRMGTIACCLAVLLLAVALVTGRLAHSAPAQLSVEDAVVRLPVVPGRPAAGYFTIRGGVHADRLLGVASPIARIEMHATTRQGGAMRMTPLMSVEVPATATVAFASGGRHLMIYGLPASVKPGQRVKLTFTFEKAGAIPVEAVARTAADANPHAGH